MKPWLIAALIVALAATALPGTADAKRLAGGKSTGLQRNMPARTAPDAPPAKPAAPAQAGQQATPAATPGAAPAAATPPKRSWMGPIAGLAAGLGLAALMSHLGMGEAFANGLMLALLAGGAALLVMFLLRRFTGAGRAPALAGAGGAIAPMPMPMQRTEPPLQRSAEPAFTPAAAAAAIVADDTVTRAFVPAAFDSEAFARTAKMIFIRLQAAHDNADLDDLKRFTTPEMFASVRLDIQERGATPQHTDVVDVAAAVLDVAQEAERQVVSVRFHGHLVEERGGAPVAFNEVWHLVRPHDDSKPWAIAGIEQMA
jgi:predicted lipid-binding transport protein (Tim44 family)